MKILVYNENKINFKDFIGTELYRSREQIITYNSAGREVCLNTK